MPVIDLGGRSIPIDDEGYLVDLNEWSPEVAEQLAQREGITLSASHWEIIYLLREFYQEFDHSPSMRPLSKYAKTKLGADKAGSIYLMRLFPQSPPKLGARIAGLPRPANCI